MQEKNRTKKHLSYKLKTPFKKTAVKDRLKKLKATIYKYDHYYYNLDQPEISDYEYDQLFKELVHLEKQYPELVKSDSPSQRVPGKALSHFEKALHKTPMLSLQNTYNENEIISFYEKTLNALQSKSVDFLLEPKLDGVAINLLYERGRLTQALTRGDGNMGENVFENIKTIRSIPLQLPISDEILEIRGEIILLKHDFKQINEQQEEQGLSYFANPRNMAAGSLRQLDPTVTARRPLRFFAHSKGFFKGIKLKTQNDFLKKIKNWGLPVLPVMDFESFQIKNKHKAFAACVLCKNKHENLEYFYLIERIRHQLAFEIDGIVMKVNMFSNQEKMGAVSRSPRWASAAKFEPERAQTYVQDISIQVGRTGVLTPVAILKSVQVGGVTITHATLHNQSEISKKDIRVGDAVVVGRAGDVIPEVIEVDFSKRKKSSAVFKMPQHCLSCSSTVQAVGDIVFCINPLCPSVVLQSLIHFTSKKAMNIEFLGGKIMGQLYTKKLVQKFSDIYQLSAEKLLKLDRQGQKSSQRILSSITKSQQTTLPAFIFALGIRHLGEQTAHNLSDFFIKKAKESSFTFLEANIKKNWPAALLLISTATEEELKEVPDIGEVVAHSIKETFTSGTFIKEIDLLLSSGVQILILEETKVNILNQKPFSGEKIAITGSFPQSRPQVEKLIHSLGGQVQSSVNKNTVFLLAGSSSDKNSSSQKRKKAQELNIPVLSWEQFLKKEKPDGPGP